MNTVTRTLAVSLFAALATATGPALAQAGQNGAAQGMSQSVPAPSDISDQQLTQFADAQKDVRSVRNEWRGKLKNAEDKKSAMKQRRQASQEMVEAVKDSGLTVDEYNGIAKAAQSHPKLAQRIQQAR